MPNGGLEKIGVELIAKGASKFISDLTSAQEATEGVTDAMGSAGAAKAAGSFSAAVSAAGAVVTGIGVALAAAAAAFLAVAAAAVKAAVEIAQFVAESAKLATEVEGIGLAFQVTSQRFGVSLQAMREASAGTVADFELMRLANVAVTGAGEEFGKEFGESLPTLLEVARASAFATGRDVGFLFDKIVTGVKRTQPLLIDDTGLVIKLSEANQALAQELGKTVDQLTAEEKQIALLRATLAAAAPMMEQFGDRQLTTAEQIARANASILNIKTSIGAVFQPALNTVIGSLANFASAIANLVSEGGALEPMLINIGAALSLLADIFGSAIDWITEWISNFQGTLFDGMSTTAEGMLEYGIEIVAALAEGIVEAASTVLVAAMNVIGSVLTFWLGPGSPPRVAPGLTDWGVAAMTSWLEGFTEADFSILKAVQGPLQQVLSGVDFAAVSQQLTEALATGGPDESFFNIIAQSAGEFGTEIAELARLQHGLAGATAEVEASERKLEEARNAQKAAQADVGKLTREYNQLLREGASKDVLDAKMAELQAAEERVGVTAQQAQEAEAENQAAQEQQATLQEQLALQKQLVDQLLLVAKAQQEGTQTTETGTERATKSARGLAGAMRELTGAMPSAADFDIGSRIGDAIDDAKDRLKAKFGELFAPLLEAWGNIQDKLDEVGGTFDTFKDIVSDAWEEIQERVSPILEDIRVWLEETLPIAVDAAVSAFYILKGAFIVVRRYLVIYLMPKLRELANRVLVRIRDLTQTIATFWKDKLLPAFEDVRDFIKDRLIPALTGPGSLGAVLSSFITNVLEWFDDVLERVVGHVQSLLTWVGQLITAIQNALSWLEEIGRTGEPDVRPEARPNISPSRAIGRAAIPVTAMAMPTMAGAAQTFSTVNNTMNVNVGPNTLYRPLDVDMLAAAVEQRLMRSMRLS
jgi:hypothetical protein